MKYDMLSSHFRQVSGDERLLDIVSKDKETFTTQILYVLQIMDTKETFHFHAVFLNSDNNRSSVIVRVQKFGMKERTLYFSLHF